MSLLGIGASLLGGILGRSSERKAIAAQNAYNHPSQVRARAEEAGFNPLLFVGPGVGQQTAVGGSNFMGSAIANAGLMLADDLTARKAEAKKDALSAENQKLRKKVETLTLRPKVGGLYAETESTPSRAAALGGSDGAGSRSAVRGVDGSPSGLSYGIPPLLKSHELDPRREVTNNPVIDDGGFISIDNPSLGPAFPVPAVNGEVLEMGQAAVVAGSMFYDRAKRYRASHTFGTPLARQSRDTRYQLLPPKAWRADDASKHPPKARGYQKNIYDPRPLFQQWGSY